MNKLSHGDKKKDNGLLETLKKVYQIWVKERPVQYAAAMAYYAIFSIVPIIYITLLIANMFFEELSISEQFYAIASEYFGEELVIYLQEGIASLAETADSGTILTSVIGMVSIIFSASLIFSQIHYILNKIFQVPRRTARNDQTNDSQPIIDICDFVRSSAGSNCCPDIKPGNFFSGIVYSNELFDFFSQFYGTGRTLDAYHRLDI